MRPSRSRSRSCDPERPIAAPSVFTAMARDDLGLRWSAVTIDSGDDAKDALDRITIPQDILDRIAPTALPRSSIIISDEPLSRQDQIYRTEVRRSFEAASPRARFAITPQARRLWSRADLQCARRVDSSASASSPQRIHRNPSLPQLTPARRPVPGTGQPAAAPARCGAGSLCGKASRAAAANYPASPSSHQSAFDSVL